MRSNMGCHGKNEKGACCLSRREFLAAGGLSAALFPLGTLSLATASGVESSGDAETPRILAALVRPDVDRYSMNWPGAAYDIQARQADYTKTLNQAAVELGVQMDLHPKVLADEGAADALLERVKEKRPDGVILLCQNLILRPSFDSWAVIRHFRKNRGDVPTIVFSPMGTSFLHQIKQVRDEATSKRTFVACTPDIQWLAHGVRMLKSMCEMKRTRICRVKGAAPEDIVLHPVGTTLHYVRFQRYSEEYHKVEENEEVRAFASQYLKRARKIVEPTQRDVLDAAKAYVACCRLMADEGCQGIAIDCLPHVRDQSAAAPCLGFSCLNDQGTAAACQADWLAAVSLRLTYLLLNRPGFMQNICVNTVNNRLMGAHCTCPTLLAGPEQPAAPLVLRSHAESDTGVAVQVIWPEGQEVTIMKFSHPQWGAEPRDRQALASSIVLGLGRVVRNIETPPSGGCRTSLEVELDGVDDVRDLTALHHQLFILGNHTQKFKAYCELAGIEVLPI